jgi:hypothetical protein
MATIPSRAVFHLRAVAGECVSVCKTANISGQPLNAWRDTVAIPHQTADRLPAAPAG